MGTEWISCLANAMKMFVKWSVTRSEENVHASEAFREGGGQFDEGMFQDEGVEFIESVKAWGIAPGVTPSLIDGLMVCLPEC